MKDDLAKHLGPNDAADIGGPNVMRARQTLDLVLHDCCTRAGLTVIGDRSSAASDAHSPRNQGVAALPLKITLGYEHHTRSSVLAEGNK